MSTVKHKRTISQMVKVFLALMLVVTSLGAIFPVNKAYAAEHANLTIGNSAAYDNYGTTWMWADGTIAYCGEPAKPTPSPGSYPKSAAVPKDSNRTDELRADLWFGYGGPGFDPAMWPEKWYDGSPMNDSRYLSLTHILLSDTFTSDQSAALFGCSAGFRNWVAKEIIGFNTSGVMTNPNAVGRKIANRAGEVSSRFEAFALATGGSTQTILSFRYTPGGYLDLSKVSANPSITDNNSCYALNDAKYGVYTEGACTNLVTTLTTNADGYAKSGELDPGTYFVKELEAPKGYDLDGKVYPVTVESKNTTRVNGKSVADMPQNDPAAMWVGKIDLETTKNLPQGSASLAEAHFEVKYYDGYYSTQAELPAAATRTWVVKTDADGFAALKESYKVSGDPFYITDKGNVTIPLGTVTVQEVKAPAGYLLSDSNIYLAQITSNTTLPEVETYNAPMIKEQVVRGDLEFVKIEDGTMKRMANVPFSITSKTTGESHVVVTDENGYYNTNSSWNPHSKDTNRGETSSDGVWFGIVEDGTTAPVNDSLGALPYDTYILKELPCEANQDHKLVTFETTIKRDQVTVKLGTLTDDEKDKPVIHTLATDADSGGKNTIAKDQAVIVDQVDYKNLEAGKSYTIKGTLMDKETGSTLLVGGKEVHAEKTFTPKAAAGSVEMTFTFDASALAGKTVVVFEDLYLDETKVASHADLEDEGQTVSIVKVELGTTATDKASGNHTALPSTSVTIVDAVSYTNLVPDKEYTVIGILMDKSTGKPLMIDGKEIHAEKTFRPEKSNGKIDMEFTFDASGLKGTSVVVFEDLFDNDILVAAHADINDKGQTVEFNEPPTDKPNEPGKYDKTGDLERLLPFIFAGLVCLAALGGSGYALYRRRKNPSDQHSKEKE